MFFVNDGILCDLDKTKIESKINDFKNKKKQAVITTLETAETSQTIWESILQYSQMVI